MNPTAPLVFLCYAITNFRFVNRINSELNKYGVKTWLDKKEIKVGKSLHEAIEKGISKSDFLIIVLSHKALTRPWVKQELTMAISKEMTKGKHFILPVIKEKVRIPLYLVDKKYADFSKNFDDGMSQLLDGLLPSNPIKVLKLENIKSETLLDIRKSDGTITHYRKTQSLKVYESGAHEYSQSFSSDGAIINFNSNPDVIYSTKKVSGIYEVKSKFTKPLKKGEKIKRQFTCDFLNMYYEADGHWEERIFYPARQMKITVIFPSNRPPKTWEAHHKAGLNDEKINNPIKYIKKPRPKLTLLIDSPQYLHTYMLKWVW